MKNSFSSNADAMEQKLRFILSGVRFLAINEYKNKNNIFISYIYNKTEGNVESYFVTSYTVKHDKMCLEIQLISYLLRATSFTSDIKKNQCN